MYMKAALLYVKQQISQYSLRAMLVNGQEKHRQEEYQATRCNTELNTDRHPHCTQTQIPSRGCHLRE